MMPGFLYGWVVVAGIVAVANGAKDEPRRFALGVEYMVPGLAEVYAKTGVIWAKAAAMGCTWGDIEPQPPVDGKHSYHWDTADRIMLEYQRAGFRRFHVYVRCMNRWASSKPIKPIGGGSWLPKPEYMQDYKAFLRAFVQRYDTHHPDHVAGLLYPVEYWEIESEWGTGFWQGTLQEYLELLKVAYPTVKQANPRAKVILIGLFLAGLFEGHPDPREIPATLATIPQARRRHSEQYLADIRSLLAHPDLFDVVEFHSLSDWSEISGMARFLRQTMRQYGYEKPIWVGDVNYTASPLMFWGIPVPPYTEKQKPAIQATLDALARPAHPRHAEAMAWFRAEQSRGLVKKVVLAMGEGLAGINIGNLKDEKLFGLLPQISGTVAFQGLIETTGTPPKPGEPRPAYHALAVLVVKLGAFTAVEHLDAGQGVYAYRFTVGGRPVYVLWYDDGRRYLPGDKEPAIGVKIPLPVGQYRLTETPTVRGPIPVGTVVVPQGGWNAELGCTPIFSGTHWRGVAMTNILGILCLVVAAVGQQGVNPASQPAEAIALPIATRAFRTGTTPSVDRTNNPAAAYVLSKQVGVLVMLWVTPNGVGLYEKLSQTNPVAKKTNYEAICDMGLVPVVNLNPWTVRPGKGVVRNDGSGSRDFAAPQFRQRMCDEARQVAARFRPQYFSIGNEVNSVYEWLGSAAFDDLASLEKAMYQAVKAASPSTKVLVVLSYSQLVDLPGTPRFHLVDKLDGAYDVLGVTTYPWKTYATPKDMPADYYTRLAKHTDRPLGFTEIAWSSDPAQGGSEDEQVEFLVRFLELTKSLRLEFVNWAFLHDLPESSVTGWVVQRTHLGLGLRRHDGSPKKVWECFRALSGLHGP